MRRMKLLWLLLPLAHGLAGCSKEIDVFEEVELDNPKKIEIIKRRELYERVIHQLSPRWWKTRSEIFLFDKSNPDWSDNLRPLYLERLPENQGYLLVTGIESSTVCFQRGRPSSYYITFHLTHNGAKEIPTPSRLEGVPTNLLLSGVLYRKPANGRVFTLPEKTELTRLGGYAERERKLLLTSKFGC